ncbi:MAG TPA: tail fiber protein [Bryobacteraceae bacterium]|jgi:microcystin-dependent protein|nr:tail fiber protein [Bryobacteraceae bacterium]
MTPFLGQLGLFSFGFAPRGWALCAGQLLPINQYQALFSLLGTTYGGDGRTTFGLPDLQGRTPVSIGNGIALGQKGGEEQHTLTTAEVPSHNHAINGTTNAPNAPAAGGNLLAQTGTGVTLYKQNPSSINSPLDTRTIVPYGSSQPHENRSPYLAMNWCIALTGIFPSQN